jgi:hypothetical protein
MFASSSRVGWARAQANNSRKLDVFGCCIEPYLSQFRVRGDSRDTDAAWCCNDPKSLQNMKIESASFRIRHISLHIGVLIFLQ